MTFALKSFEISMTTPYLVTLDKITLWSLFSINTSGQVSAVMPHPSGPCLVLEKCSLLLYHSIFPLLKPLGEIFLSSDQLLGHYYSQGLGPTSINSIDCPHA